MVELQGASKRFGDTVALSPTDLAFRPGETTVLIGPSGCGKSTVLRLLVGLLEPDDGAVRFDGAPLTPATLRAARLRMGYVIQDGGLFPHLTARQNATLMAAHQGWASERIEARVQELRALTDLDDGMLDRHPGQLSGGQRQRVSLMRALMLDPAVLLLDEPLGALDPLIRADLQRDLREVFRSLGKTVVMVTHDLAEAAFFADEIVLLRDGAIIQRGGFADLAESPANEFVTRFVNAQRALTLS
jgi:osmoprotectant transport system ATP-binding protein